MRQNIPDCRQELEEAVVQLDVSDKLKKIIGQIVLTNHEHGRFHYYMKYAGCAQTLPYVQQVAATYQELNPYVSKVMAGEDEVWYPLYAKMQQWSYRFLLTHNFYKSKETLDLAIGYASEAGGTLITARFPYDVPVFDAWAIQLVKNVCRKNMRHSQNASHIPDEKTVDINTNLVYGEDYRDIAMLVEKGYDLEAAIKQLNEQEQKVIRGTLIGMSTDELAQMLGVKPGTIYKIRHEAIQKLRRILGV